MGKRIGVLDVLAVLSWVALVSLILWIYICFK